MNLPELFEHQKNAIKDAEKYPSRLIFRLPGTGKTRIGIEIIKNNILANRYAKILWISPANLIPQLKNNFGIYGIFFYDIFPERKILEGKCGVCSYDMLRLNENFFPKIKWDLIICDEIHKAKSYLTQTNHSLWSIRKKAIKWYGLTGTPFQNSPYEFFELVSLCAGRKLEAKCENCLQYKYPKFSPLRKILRSWGIKINRLNQGPIIGIKDPELLGNIIHEVVDYLSPDRYLQECQLPEISFEDLKVKMTVDEDILYKKCLHKISRKKRYRSFVADDAPDEKIESIFKSFSELRTISLQTSKPLAIIELISSILDNSPQAKILVFCNFVQNGLKILSKKLFNSHISHILYCGNVSPSQRAEYIKEFYHGEKNILLLSPVGFEGLDLYGTTHIIIMDPHYNPERTRQLMSRAIRAFSGIKRLKIIKLKSYSESINQPLIDEIIEKISLRKSHLGKLLEDVLCHDVKNNH